MPTSARHLHCLAQSEAILRTCQASRSELLLGMAPRARIQETRPVVADLPAEVEAQVRACVEAADRGELVALTRAEVERWAATGQLPESLENWVGRSLPSGS